MTEFTEEHDELASAYLDGEATDDERARVEGDAGLLARVDELRQVRDAVGASTGPVDGRARDGAIDAALRASPIVDLRAERARRRLRIVSIAAAVLIVLGAAGLVIRSASSNTTAKSAATAAGSAAPQDDSRVATEGAGATSPAANIPGAFSLEGREPLGDFTDRSALAGAAATKVHDRLSVDRTKTASSSFSSAASRVPDAGTDTAGAPPSCAPSAPPNAVAEVYAATANLDGRAVQLDVFSTTEDTLVLVVTDATTCAPVFTQAV